MKPFLQRKEGLYVLSILVVWEITSIVIALIMAGLFIMVKELFMIQDHFVNGILLYSFVTLALQIVQLRHGHMESAGISMLINMVAYIFNMICIFHILSGAFQKKRFISSKWIG